MGVSKVVSPQQAAALIPDGATIGSSTMGLTGWPEEVAIAIEQRFLATGHPRDVTLVHSSTCGDYGKRGTTRLGHEGLVKRLVCGHTGSSPNMTRLVDGNKIECYLLPQGVICQLWRAIAGRKPGVITKVGLGTYVDPRLGGGKVTTLTREDLVSVVNLDGEEWLLYKAFPIHVALIRGSVGDEDGNLTMDREMGIIEALPLAMAAKNSGGIVIAQVEWVAQRGTLHPRQVRVPGVLVDYLVIGRPENHLQTQQTYFNPSFSGDVKIPLHSIPPLPLDATKIIARRAAMELRPGAVVNLGVGIPAGVASVAVEEGVLDLFTLTTELGVFGGVPAFGLDFGASYNPEAMIDHSSMFDYYDGGGLDIAFLGLAQVDREGNVNVSKFGNRVMGPGGFINISQNAKKIVFCGRFANASETEVKDGTLVIGKEGAPKFVDRVDQVTFSGAYATRTRQTVLYVTERAVFTLEDGCVTLREVAPGVDIEKHIIAMMGFPPKLSPALKVMDRQLFQPQWGRLREIMENP